ncbi:hypothetical protein QQS21_009969 [Conoideocrella luteorostrata]|uniref:Uncharacterized protein n=1 Tax=Conoideocrella luteorostrata TaxID=1105319 RepID=A0AAJ0FUM9_9HYPO|nr:hypothetical protein QQS21_009969 [Conoideocrella luteorostrata]
MAQPEQRKVVFFDLDNTLFDCHHALRCATSALQSNFAVLAGITTKELIRTCKALFHRDMYFDLEEEAATPTQMHVDRIERFFSELCLPKPSLQQIKIFCDKYKQVYQSNRRATQGSIHAIVRLRENGYEIGSISARQPREREELAKSLGVRHLIDRFATSIPAQDSHLDHLMIQLSNLGLADTSNTTFIVGDLANFSIQNATKNKITTIVYSPISDRPECSQREEGVIVIRHMSNVLNHLRISTSHFKPSFTLHQGQLAIQGIGLDVVAEPGDGLHLPRDTVRCLARNMAIVLTQISEKIYVAAMTCLADMIHTITSAATSTGKANIRILIPNQVLARPTARSAACRVIDREHSICVELEKLLLDTDVENESVARSVAIQMQQHCNELMRNNPRAAVGCLRSAIIRVAEVAGIREHIIISGDYIDPWIGSKVKSK